MYGPTDLKKNTLITLDGQPYKVVEYSQKVMGRGGSIVNVKDVSDQCHAGLHYARDLEMFVIALPVCLLHSYGSSTWWQKKHWGKVNSHLSKAPVCQAPCKLFTKVN